MFTQVYTNRKFYTDINTYVCVSESIKDVGKLFIDNKGAGRLYIPKSMMEKLSFENGEKVKLTLTDGILVVEKL